MIRGRFLPVNEEKLQWAVVFCCLLVFTGFVCSRALASIGMMSILGLSLLFYGPQQTFKVYFQKKQFLVLSLYFLVVFISGIYSDDKSNWLESVRIKLPYLALPIAFAHLTRLNDRKFSAVLHGFIAILFISTLVVLFNYVKNYQSITDSYHWGSGMAMPFSHIRYALMVAFSFFCCLYLYQKKHFLFRSGKWILPLVAVLLFIIIHILSVRSGILALYLGLGYWALYEIVRQKRILIGLAILALIAIAPFIAYKYMPSFRNKIAFMQYDLDQYRHGQLNDLSDAMRLVSMKTGIKIWEESPIIGVGAGDLKAKSDRIQTRDYPQITLENHRQPHNQFIWMLASTGIIGLAAFLLAFIYPVYFNTNYKHWIVIVFHLILFSSFFTEHTFEEQVGTGFYLIFLMIFLNHYQTNE